MPIIIEGPDGAGKSTLAKALADRLDMNILKMTANGGQSATEYMQKLAWYFTGREDVEFISKFSSFWEHISDDGVTNRSAYGAIVFNRYGFDQVAQVIDTLKRDPCSRRAVINFNVPNPERFETKDEICTIAMSSDTPRPAVSEYCLNNAIVTEVNDEN